MFEGYGNRWDEWFGINGFVWLVEIGCVGEEVRWVVFFERDRMLGVYGIGFVDVRK